MRYTRAVVRLLAETLAYGRSTRRLSLVLVVVVGLVVALIAILAQLTAPLALYPFA